jgi:hypothetical protein
MTTFKREYLILGMFAVAVIFLAAGAGTGQAQHLISSRAGFVNRADGKVYVTRAGSGELEGSEERGRASLGTQMRNGDLLTTEPGAFAEVLLNPGAYLRMNEKTSLRAINTSLTNVQFELVSGSAILEVGEVSKDSPLQINTAHGQFVVKRDGLHRFDIAGNATRVAVRQGELWLGSREEVMTKGASGGIKIGRGKTGLFKGSGTPELAKVDRDAFDDFDVWSFNRAQTLVAANNSALSQSRSFNSLASGWFFDPFSGGYTFIPRNGMFWSPYGFGFFNSFGNCFTCMNSLFYRGYNSIYGNGRGQNGGGILTPNTPAAPGRVINGSDGMAVRREISGRQVDLNPMGDASIGGGRGMGMGGPVTRSIGATAPMVIAAPAPSRGMDGGGAGGGAAPARPSRN